MRVSPTLMPFHWAVVPCVSSLLDVPPPLFGREARGARVGVSPSAEIWFFCLRPPASSLTICSTLRGEGTNDTDSLSKSSPPPPETSSFVFSPVYPAQSQCRFDLDPLPSAPLPSACYPFPFVYLRHSDGFGFCALAVFFSPLPFFFPFFSSPRPKEYAR